MTLHVAAGNWYATDVNSFSWQALNFWDALVRCGVPVFVMISGALFLYPRKEIPVSKLYTKYIPRILIALIFWSFVYAMKDYVKTGDLLKACAHFIRGHYHLWFLFMITGLYMIVPFLRKIAESEKLTKYYLVLALIFTFTLPECANIISVFSEKYGTFAEKYVAGFHMEFVAGYTGYFLLGYVLDRMNISPKLERVIYLAGVLGVSFTVLMSSFASVYMNEATEMFYKNQTVNVMCESVAVFVFFRMHFNRESVIIRKLSQYSFGAYLVHDAVIQLIRKLGLHSLTFCPVFSVPVAAAVVFMLSFTISGILNHVPVLKKYIV